MAEETSSTKTAAEISSMAQEAPIPQEESSPNERSDAPDEEEAKETPAAEEVTEADSSAPDHKRKLEDLEKEVEEEEAAGADLEPVEKPGDLETKEFSHGSDDAKRQKVDVDADGIGVDGVQEVNVEPTTLGNGQLPFTEHTNSGSAEIPQNYVVLSQEGTLPPAGHEAASRKIEVPNNKVGVLIGKAGETIRNLQQNSGAEIQITRDAQADPNSSGRPVELIGTLEQINKAEQLIKDVIAEADAGGSPALIAQGYGITQFGAEVYEMQVPNEKVGPIIGKGGETIKRLQTTSGARIQLIPQHLPDGDVSKERTVRVTGTKKQIEAAKEMVKEVMIKVPIRPSPLSSGYSQNYRPRGPTPGTKWGPRGPPPAQNQPQPTTGYNYQQRGMYPQSTQYPPQSYSGGYPQQPPPRSNHSTGWEQRPGGAPMQNPPTGGYNYYGQGGPALGTQQPNNPASANYGHPQAAGYGQTNPYPQSGPTQQNYGPGYNEPKYDNQAPTHQVYGQQPPTSSQPGFYPQQGSTAPQPGYAQQQPYSKPAPYSGGPPPQSYGPPRATTQQGDPMYQGQAPSSYGPAAPTQQSYPYDSGAPSQPAPAYTQTYGPPSGSVDGYSQPPPAGYSQTGYPQGGQPAYGQYASAQPSYGEPPASNNANYGYQGGSGDTGYGNTVPSAGYGAMPAVSTQAGYPQAGGYAQPAANPVSYDQSAATQYGYGGQPGTAAPAGYAKGVSPQPGAYGWTS